MPLSTIGRPKLAPHERRAAQLPPVRMTDAEAAFVAEQAARAGLSLSDFVRRAVLGMRVQPARSAADDAALLELNRIGVNLNQIARALNSDRPEHGVLPDVLDDLRRILTALAAGADGGEIQGAPWA